MTPSKPSDLDALRVLRAIVDIETQGADPYEASAAITADLGLSAGVYEACLKRLVTGGYIYGGRYFSGPYVEGTTERGRLAISKWLTIEAALDHVLEELDDMVENDERHDAGSQARSLATWVGASQAGSDLDIIDRLIDLDRGDGA
ncbi:hypothetical protein [Nocardioides sp.]|uniref:hypothetical protein n=1 Tax=Nocardioides sp. TaxID=35761 RepID=UPI0035B0809F